MCGLGVRVVGRGSQRLAVVGEGEVIRSCIRVGHGGVGEDGVSGLVNGTGRIEKILGGEGIHFGGGEDGLGVGQMALSVRGRTGLGVIPV